MIWFFKTKSEAPKNIHYPFFASTKYSLDNVRSGPGKEYPIVWIYKMKQLPLKVIAGYNDWYEIEDFSGKSGWLKSSNVSNFRSAFTKAKVAILSQPLEKSQRLGVLDAHIVVRLLPFSKNGYVKVEYKSKKLSLTGWALSSQLWGGPSTLISSALN